MNETAPYKMNTFARLTGVSAPVLRAWERRHGLVRPQRQGGGHRFFDAEDLQLVRHVKRLLDEGRTIGEVAAKGREQLLMESRQGLHPTTQAANGNAQRLIDRIVEGARTLNPAPVREALDEAFGLLSPLVALHQIVEPAVKEIGRAWQEGRITVAGEHMVSAALQLRVLKLLEVARNHRDARPIICACVPGEQHELGLLFMALHASVAGRSIAYFGRDLPFEDLELITTTLTPTDICLSVTRADRFERIVAPLAALAPRLPAQIHLGGQGAPRTSPALEAAGVKLWGDDHAGFIARLGG